MWKTGRRERGWRDTTRDTRVKNWGESEFKKKVRGMEGERMESQTTEGWIQ